MQDLDKLSFYSRRMVAHYAGQLSGMERLMMLVWLKFRHHLFVWRSSSKLLWANLFAKEGVLTRDVQGSRMALSLNDAGIGRELALFGVHEPASTNQLKKEIKADDVVFEIGANIGYYLLLCLRLSGKKGRAIAFEPSPDNLQLLKKNIELNGVSERVELFPYAADAQNGTRLLYMTNKSNTCSLSEPQGGQGIVVYRSLPVEVRAIDSFVSEHGCTFDYFRMDVEGHEYDVVKGMLATLSSSDGPHGCFIEVHAKQLRDRHQSVSSFLSLMHEAGFDLSRAFYRGRSDIVVDSSRELLAHPLLEIGYWEAFFRKTGDIRE